MVFSLLLFITKSNFMKFFYLMMLCAFSCVGLLAQSGVTVSGTVTDEDGTAIIGASLIEEGTSIGTVTNIDGNFSLNVSSADVN